MRNISMKPKTKTRYVIQMLALNNWINVDWCSTLERALRLASVYVNGFGDGKMEDMFRVCKESPEGVSVII